MYLNEDAITARQGLTDRAHVEPKRARSRLKFVTTQRFQLVFGLALAVAVPALARSIYEPHGNVPIDLDKSLFGTLFAFLLGYLLLRKVSYFPGARATAYILPVFASSYVLTALSFFFLRLDYSRLQFGISFVVCVLFFYWVLMLARRLKRPQLSIIPGRETSRLTSLKMADWRTLPLPGISDVGHGIVADLKAPLHEDWERLIADRALAGVPIYDAKSLYESLTGRVQIEHISENPFGALSMDTIYASGKRYVDFALAAVAIAILAPLLLVVGVAIRLESPGPAIFRQQRMGYRGRIFTVYKLRTMRCDRAAVLVAQAEMTVQADPRITRLGRFLRKTRIDELPQLINILRGEMSWIGPRPEALTLSRWYESMIPFYRYRHIVRPGITGWAQVNQGHVTSLDDADIKLQYDFYYVKNFSLWLDMLVALKTIGVIFTGSGAK